MTPTATTESQPSTDTDDSMSSHNSSSSSSMSTSAAPLKKRKISIAVKGEGTATKAATATVAAKQDLKQRSAVPDMDQAQAELEKCLKTLRHEDRVHLDKARRLHPKLVEQESDPRSFLRREDYNVEAAAKRLVAYWKERVGIFSASAFSPVMSLSQTDAMSEEDVATMSSGLIAKLPNDKQGRTVLCMDRTRSDQPDAALNECWLRTVFYWLLLASTNERSQTDGIVLIRVVRNPNENQARFQKMLNLIKNAMPVKISAFHLCCLPPRGSMRAFTDTFVPVCKRNFSDNFNQKALVHLASSESEMVNKLERNGLVSELLPASIGGSWTYAKFDAWLNQRIRVDIRNTALMSTKQPATTEATSDGPSTLNNLVVAADLVRIQDRRDRKRKMDAIYARKRRERERCEEQGLQNECLELNTKNLKLQNENRMFEEMLAKAKEAVAQHEANSAGAATTKKADDTVEVPAAAARVINFRPHQQQQQQQSCVPLSPQPRIQYPSSLQQGLPSMAPPSLQQGLSAMPPPSLDASALQRALLQNQQQQQQQAVIQQHVEREEQFRRELLLMINSGSVSAQNAAQILQERQAALQAVAAQIPISTPPVSAPSHNVNGLSDAAIMALLGSTEAPKQHQQAAVPAQMVMQQTPSFFMPPSHQNQAATNNAVINPGLLQYMLQSQSRNSLNNSNANYQQQQQPSQQSQQQQQQQQQQPKNQGAAQYFMDFLRRR